jgi:hypothetical protein
VNVQYLFLSAILHEPLRRMTRHKSWLKSGGAKRTGESFSLWQQSSGAELLLAENYSKLSLKRMAFVRLHRFGLALMPLAMPSECDGRGNELGGATGTAFECLTLERMAMENT